MNAATGKAIRQVFMRRIVCNFRGLASAGVFASARLCLIVGLACSLGACAWLDAKQRVIVFRPTPGAPASFNGLRPGDVSFATEVPGILPGTFDRLQMWWLPQPDAQAPTLLYLHGTFRNLYGNIAKIEALRQAGFSILAVDYRGWGDSSPIVPSEASIYADADTAWAELQRRQPDPHKRVIYGHSMGGGVAVDLASRKHAGADYAALILESTFTRLPDVAAANGVVGTIASWFATEQFDSVAKIGRVDAPILMLHGDADKTVPVELGRKLRDAAPPGTRWVEIAGGTHSALQSDAPAVYQQALKALIDRLH
jgi:pimeloyl-ACP methyl ester carboxylesterase